MDIAALRADTPGCENVIHFNNAGAALMPIPVLDALQQHLSREAAIGGYEAEDEASAALGSFYTEFAALLRCQPDEIAYVENATRAWDMAFYGLKLAEGDRILTHASEYASNYLAMMQLAARKGVAVDLVPSDNYGQIDVAALGRKITPRHKLIALTHVPTQGGLVNPAAEVGRVAAEYGLIYLLDACQSVGQIDVDVTAIGCHILSGTGRKFLRGPRGTGFLYVSNTILDQIEPPFIDMHAATWTRETSYSLAPGARRFENWESYVAGRIGLARAVAYARAIGLPAIETRVTSLAADLRQQIGALPGFSTHDLGERQCGIVTFNHASIPVPKLAQHLHTHNINVTASHAQNNRFDFPARGLTSVIRASLHYYNTESEIAHCIKVLSTLTA